MDPTPSSSAVRRVQVLASHLNASSNTLAPMPTAGSDDSDYTRAKINQETIAKERAASRFDVKEMAYVIDGGKEKTEVRFKISAKDPIFHSDDQWNLNIDDTRKRTFEKVVRATELFLKDGNEEKAQSRAWVFEMLDPSMETVLGVHYFLFRPAIENCGSIEQIHKYLPDAIMSKILGCFAMTEIGTGSNVPGIETTATFDEKTQEFILNTPALTATKWWIGGAADLSTHTVLFARLIVKGEDHGIQMFVVQLRDLDTHKVLPNIKVGDCGEKYGRHGIPNGWIQFNNRRVPLDALLNRFTSVSPDGKVTKKGTAQQAYSALIGGRVIMANRAANTLAHMLTIAVRYGAIRRQFTTIPGEPQTPVLNYAIHQNTLMPLLAGAYVLHFTARKVEQLYNQGKDMAKANDFSLLSDIHNMSAGLKPFSTWLTHYGIDELRQSCGGHGYSAYSRFARTQASWAVMCTWEGSNPVLAQQLSQSLIKAFQRFMSGKDICAGGQGAEKLTSMDYIRKIPDFMGGAVTTLSPTDDWRQNPEQILEAWEYIPGKLLIQCAQMLTERMGEGAIERVAWNATTVELVRLSKAHTYLFMLRSFYEACIDPKHSKVKEALLRLFNLFALYHMEQYTALLLEDGFFTSDHFKNLKKMLHDALGEVRKDAVPYVDAFSFTDFVVQSPLGRYDGNIYEHYFAEVNKHFPQRERPPWYESTIKPALRNNFQMPPTLVETLKLFDEEAKAELAKLSPEEAEKRAVELKMKMVALQRGHK